MSGSDPPKYFKYGEDGQREEFFVVVPTPNRAPALDEEGRLHPGMIPGGTNANTAILTAKEAIVLPGRFVYFHGPAGGIKRATNANPLKQALGYVLQSASIDEEVTVYFEGINTGLVGLLPGKHYYLGANGGVTGIRPTEPGLVVQSLGVAIKPNALVFRPGEGAVVT